MVLIAVEDAIGERCWHMERVPPDRWVDFSALRRHEHIDMLTRSDFLHEDILEAMDAWMASIDGGYPVQLHCTDCGALRGFEADSDDADCEDKVFQLSELDERMAPFMREHAACRWQLRLFDWREDEHANCIQDWHRCAFPDDEGR